MASGLALTTTAHRNLLSEHYLISILIYKRSPKTLRVELSYKKESNFTKVERAPCPIQHLTI